MIEDEDVVPVEEEVVDVVEETPEEVPKKASRKRRQKVMVRKSERVMVPLKRQSPLAYIRLYFSENKRSIELLHIKELPERNRLNRHYLVTFKELDFE